MQNKGKKFTLSWAVLLLFYNDSLFSVTFLSDFLFIFNFNLDKKLNASTKAIN